MQKKTVCVVGLGYIGLPTAALLQELIMLKLKNILLVLH